MVGIPNKTMIKNGITNKKKCRFRIPTKYESKDEMSKLLLWSSC